MKNFLKILVFFIFQISISSYAQTTLISPTVNNGGFESGTTGWVIVNGNGGSAQANKWFIGSTAYCNGSNGAYVGTGTNNNNYNNTSSTVHLYRDFTFPAGETNITLTFNWRCAGESTYDYMRVFLVPTSTNPTAGTALTATVVGNSYYNQQTSCGQTTITLPASAAGTTQRLVFSWRNDGSVNNTPAITLDDVTIITDSSTPPPSGCTNNTSLYPSTTYTPSCIGTAEIITTGGWATEYSNVNVVSGTAYTFASSISTDYLTIANSTGTIVYTSGTTPVSWTATFTGVVRFYNNTNSSCGTNTTSRTRTVQCGTPPSCPGGLGTAGTDVFSVTLPYSSGATTTCGKTNNLTSSNTPVCGSSSYYTGEDVVYYFTPSVSGQVTLSLISSGSWTGMMLYEGCPFNGVCVSQAQSSAGNESLCVSVVAGVTYYLIIDSYASPVCNAFSLTISAPASGVPNDLPCNATPLVLGVSTNGNNNCTSGSSEPSSPSCWTSGNLNTIWYSFVAPSSGTVSIQTTLLTIASTQIALYSGNCSSLTLVACNQDISSGCSGSSNNSLITATGLTSGATYYVRVDGEYDNVGTFSLTVTDGTGAMGPVPGQDCLSPLVVCNSVMTIGNPGYTQTGNVCDFTGTGNCTGGEKNAVWYQINIANTGNFNFVISPNDANNNSCGSETDYDFLLWKISGSGTTTSCPTISSSSGTALLACNYDFQGVTGVGAGGNAPAPFNACYNSAFEPTVAVTSGDILYLVVQNFSGSTQGFTLDMTGSGSGVVNFTAPSTVYWTGGANTTWTNYTNWGSCATYPVCGVNAVITSSSANQPVLTGTEYVKNLTINPGGTLTLGAGSTLYVCGDFVNNGNLVCSPTSNIIFNNAAVTQNISGSLTGSNKLGNLVINKTGGSVILGSPIEIGGNFTTSNATSIFNTSGLNVFLGGNFNNSAGNITYTNTGTSGTLEFNGAAAQNYNQGSSNLDLNHVILNHTGPGVTLQTFMRVKPSSGTLTLTQGKIITNANEVAVFNTTPASVTIGNINSFVQGNLRRYLNGLAASYDFPVGHSSKGYQRANITFSTATAIGNLLAYFSPYTLGVPNGPVSNECALVNYSTSPALDNGFWTIDANANPTSGNYNVTLYNTNYTNSGGAMSWTVMKDNGSGWLLNGACNTASTAPQAMRNGLNGFSKFATAQSTVPFPIELITFSGKQLDNINLLEWITATETNNELFIIERSDNGKDFLEIGRVKGAGNSLENLKYEFKDIKPGENQNYYQLRQLDFDGGETVSEIIVIQNKTNAFVSVFPNPASGELTVNVMVENLSEVKVELYDVFGSLIFSKNSEIKNSGGNILIDLMNISDGLYFINVSNISSGLNFSEKVLIKH